MKKTEINNIIISLFNGKRTKHEIQKLFINLTVTLMEAVTALVTLKVIVTLTVTVTLARTKTKDSL